GQQHLESLGRLRFRERMRVGEIGKLDSGLQRLQSKRLGMEPDEVLLDVQNVIAISGQDIEDLQDRTFARFDRGLEAMSFDQIIDHADGAGENLSVRRGAADQIGKTFDVEAAQGAGKTFQAGFHGGWVFAARQARDRVVVLSDDLQGFEAQIQRVEAVPQLERFVDGAG